MVNMSPPIEATVSFQCQEQISNQNTTSYLATARLMWLRPILAGRWLMKGPLRGEKETAGLGTVSHSDIFVSQATQGGRWRRAIVKAVSLGVERATSGHSIILTILIALLILRRLHQSWQPNAAYSPLDLIHQIIPIAKEAYP